MEPNSIEQLLSTIESTLPGFRMSRVSGVAELAAGTSLEVRRFVVRTLGEKLQVRVAEQLDVEADAIVLDGELGSLGLIHAVPSEKIEPWLRQRIGEGTLLRQLLLEQVRPGMRDSRKIAFAVELVFVVAELPGPEADGVAAQLGGVLRSIIREAGFLYAVGINVWRSFGTTGLDDARAVRRAFSWLLKDSEAWYKQSHGDPPAKSEFGAITRLELDNFRLAGKRGWTLGNGHTLHLVHGHNGSGKSSLCEALEIVVTGKVERIGDADHVKVLTNRAAQAAGAATVSLVGDRGDRRIWPVGPRGVDQPLQPGLAAASFRMDQGLADRLSQSDSAARARLFVEAFFPEHRLDLKMRGEAEGALIAALQKLPGYLRSTYVDTSDRPDVSKIKGAPPWAANTLLSWAKIVALLPISPEQVAALGPLLPPDFREAYQRTGEADAASADSAMVTFQKGLAQLMTALDQNLQCTNDAVALLEEYGNETVESLPSETEDLNSLFNKWLELVALTDIFEQEDRLVAAIATALGKQYSFQQAEPLLARQVQTTARSDRLAAIQNLKYIREQLRLRVLHHNLGGAEGPAGSKHLKPLTEFRAASLDAAAALGVFGDRWRGAGITGAVQEAFGEPPKLVQVRSGDSLLVVGEEHWGHELLSGAVRVRDALKSVAVNREDVKDAVSTLDKLVRNLQEMYEAALKLSAIDDNLEASFAKLIGDSGPLSQAVNEIMALFTPARWAYEDIVARAEFKSSTPSLAMQTEDAVPTQLRLNTAELNTFAITLFLLCARRVDSVLRIIVLDDPLQNMDELTVVTIARGLGRLLRLWQRLDKRALAWRVVILVHSEEDIEWFRSEMPCIAYLLPWLSPHDAASGPVQEARIVPSKLVQELQPLGALLTPSPPVAAVHE